MWINCTRALLGRPDAAAAAIIATRATRCNFGRAEPEGVLPLAFSRGFAVVFWEANVLVGTGHHIGDPFYCEESDGVWVQGQPYMSPQDRHGCGVVDVDQDGFDDVVCAIGTHLPTWPS